MSVTRNDHGPAYYIRCYPSARRKYCDDAHHQRIELDTSLTNSNTKANEKLTRDFSAADEKIVSLEGKLQTLSGLLLLQPAPSINRPHSESAGGVNDNGQSMTRTIESAGDENRRLFYSIHCFCSLHVECLYSASIFSHRLRSHE